MAAAASDETVGRVTERLLRLEAAQLVRSSAPGRYVMHDLVRLYARELASEHQSDNSSSGAVRRGLEHYLAVTRQITAILSPDLVSTFGTKVRARSPASAPATTSAAAAWIDSEAVNLRSIASQGAGMSEDLRILAAEVANASWAPLRFRGALEQLVELARLALQARNARIHLAIGLRQLGRITQARRQAEQAVAAQRSNGGTRGLAAALNALAGIHRVSGRIDDAEAYYQEAVTVCESLGEYGFLPVPLTNLGSVQQDRGNCDRAVEIHERSVVLAETAGLPEFRAMSLCNLAEALRRSGRPAVAVVRLEQALGIVGDLGNRQVEAAAWWSLGYAHDDLGRTDKARRCWRTALDILEETGALTPTESREFLKPGRPPIPDPIRWGSAASPFGSSGCGGTFDTKLR